MPLFEWRFLKGVLQVNRFFYYHPSCEFLFFFFVISVSMAVHNPFFLAISFFTSFAYLLRLKGKSALLQMFKFILPLLVIVTVLNGFMNSYGFTVLFELPWGNSVTAEALFYGFCQGLVFTSVIMWFMCYNEILTSEKFLYLFGKIFPNITLMISMILRFIPHFKQKSEEIRQSRQGAGIRKEKKWAESIAVFSTLVSYCLESSISLSLSMKSKGYPSEKRKPYCRYKFKSKDWKYILITSANVLVVSACIFSGKSMFLFEPELYFENSLLFVLSCICFFVVCISPLAIDLTEDFKWRILKLKM